MARQVLSGSGTQVLFGILHPDLLAQDPVPLPPDVQITLASAAVVGAATLTTVALAAPLPAGSALQFYPPAGAIAVVLSAAALKGATTLTVTAISAAVAIGAKIQFIGYEFSAEVTAIAASSATTITVKPLKQALLSGAAGRVFAGSFQTAYTSADATTGEISLSVLALDEAIATASIALHRGLLLLQGGTSVSEEVSTDEESVVIFGDGAGYANGSATGASWTMSYEALVLPGEPGYYRLSYAARNAVKGVFGYVVKRDTPASGFIFGEQFEGLCQLVGISKDNPSDGNITFSTSFNGRGEPTSTPPRK